MKRRSLAISILIILVFSGCQSAREPDMNTKARPVGHQLVATGNIILDDTTNGILPKRNLERVIRQNVRPPLWGLYELLKGPNMARKRTATISSLAWPLGKGPGAGKPALAEVLAQADFDTVSIATEGLSKRSPEEIAATARSLEKRHVPVIGTHPMVPQIIALEDLNVAVLAIYIHAGASSDTQPGIVSASVGQINGAIEKIENALKSIDQAYHLVVMSVGWSKSLVFEKRAEISRLFLRQTGVDVILGHHSGEFEGLELINKKLIVYNPGPALLPVLDDSRSHSSLIIRLHLNHAGLDWVEIQPIALKNGKSSIGRGTTETYAVIDQVIGFSKMFNTNISNEFGRGILEVTSPETKSPPSK